MSNALSDLLKTRPWLMADGATGTNLFAMGLESGEPPELWNFDHPDRIRALHQGFVDAGSDVILTNSFGGTRYRLKLHNHQDKAFELNKRAAELAREVADGVPQPVVVAGSVGPTGEIFEPVGTLSMSDAVAAFEEQIKGLMAGGADVIWAETISSEEEISAIAQACKNLDAPLCATLSFDTAGRTMMGITSTEYAELQGGLPSAPIAFGANCGTGAPDLLRTVLGLSEASTDAVVIAKSNAGIPKYVDGLIEYDGTPELMGIYACLALDAGARIVGGCCGTKPEHLRAMKAAMEAHTPRERPALEVIASQVGPFSSANDGTGDQSDAPQRARRGRRRA